MGQCRHARGQALGARQQAAGGAVRAHQRHRELPAIPAVVHARAGARRARRRRSSRPSACGRGRCAGSSPPATRSIRQRGVRMQLVSGPFRTLEGEWLLTPIEGGGCRVELTMRFAFSNRLSALLFEPLFAETIGSLVDAFVAARGRVRERAGAAPASAAPSRMRRASGSTCGSSSCRRRPPLPRRWRRRASRRAWRHRRPAIPWDIAAVGIFGELRTRSDPCADGDRIELYRPLTRDPRERRRERVQRSAARRRAAARSWGTSGSVLPDRGPAAAPRGCSRARSASPCPP